MELKNHAKLRYVQRVIGIEDESKAWSYMKRNKYEVSFKLLELYNNSKLIHKGFAPDKEKGVTYNYYINGDILIVASFDNSAIITLYHITIDADSDENIKKIRKYVKAIRKNNADIKKIESRREAQDKESKGLEFMISRLEAQLEELKEQYKDSVNKCIELVSESKSKRIENRDMMEEIMYGFKKFGTKY